MPGNNAVMRCRYCLRILFMAALLGPLVAQAQSMDAELEVLRKQILELKERVSTLESRFGYKPVPPVGIDGQGTDASASAVRLLGDWKDEANWKLLYKGLEASRAAEILGEPDRRKRANKFEYWYYGDGKVSVYLGRVKSWKQPSLAAARGQL